MDFAFDARTEELRAQLLEFMTTEVYPAEPVLADQVRKQADRWSVPPIVTELQSRARALGLWNLFLPGEHGAGLTNLQYAPLAEITGYSIQLAPVALNCAAPDTGNMELLAAFGSDAQKERWLRPLLDARIRSGFAMTEPDVASSDASNIRTRMERAGDEYVITGRKWWVTGAMNPACEVFIVLGVTNPQAERHRRHSMILVPRDAPGLTIRRALTVFGYADADHGGHGELEFNQVRIPADNLIGREGEGFAIAQARLGPGRIHHCMRSIGLGERALDLMCKRALERVAFGQALADQGMIQSWIAEARVRLEQLRLLALKTAWLMDTVGNKGAHAEIQAIKIATPATVEWILDKAIQVHGGAGLNEDLPLAQWFAGVRSLRIADGPDEVHLSSLARRELARHRPQTAADG